MHRLRPIIQAALLALAALPLSQSFGGGPPNTLLVLDGDASYETPWPDRVGDQGMRFTQARAMTVCHPMQICRLTGRYPARLGISPWGTTRKN